MRIKRFLGIYTKGNTVSTYRGGIYSFFDCIYGRVRATRKASKEDQAQYERLAERYFLEERNYFDDMLDFIAYMQDRAPTGARAQINAVKEFFVNNDVEFTQKQLKSIKKKMPKGKTSRTAERDIDGPMLKRILEHMDLKARAVTLTLASSGMRPDEPFNIVLSDVDLSTKPTQLVVRGEDAKEGDRRSVFISKEATDVLREWLKVRSQYLDSAKNRNAGLVKAGITNEKKTDDDRLFPFSLENFREAWNGALIKAGLMHKDNSTGRSQIRIQGTRKFFRSQLALSCPVDIVEALMGHQGYLTEAYRRYTLKQMAEYYLKAEHHVTVIGSGDIRELSDRLMDTQVTVKGYRDVIKEQAEEIVLLEQRFTTQERQLEEIREQYGELKSKEEELQALTERFRELEAKEEELEAFKNRIKRIEDLLEKEEKNPTPIYHRKASMTWWDE
jgi:integrase